MPREMSTVSQKASRQKTPLAAAYMCVFDSILFLGWFFVFCWMVLRFMELGMASLEQTYSELGTLLDFLQFLILLDILHAPLGLWGESPIPFWKRVYCKVGRRTEFYITILLVPEIYHNRAFGFVFFTWAISDICRYPFYALSCLGKKVWFIVWMRYSIFLVQYPMVLLSEALVIFYAIPYLLSRGYIPISFQWYGVPLTFMLINYCYFAIRNQISNFRKFYPHYNLLLRTRNGKLYDWGE